MKFVMNLFDMNLILQKKMATVLSGGKEKKELEREIMEEFIKYLKNLLKK